MTTTLPEPSPELLWQGVAPFEVLHQRSAATLLALVREISRRAPAGPEAGAFLAAHAAAHAHGAAVFARVWTAPAASAFAHRAYDLLRASRRGEADAERALAAHLDGFALFALCAALLGGGALRLARPLAVPRPVLLPGTRLVLRGVAPLRVHGARGGALEVSATPGDAPLLLAPGGSACGATLAPAPLAVHAGAEIPLGVEVFELPGLAPGEALAAVPDTDRAQLLAVAAALAAVERYAPAAFASLRQTLRGVALKPRGAGGFQGMSFSDFPGACIVPFSPHPVVLAEGLVHEFHHNRLFAIESALPLLAPGPDEPRHASPFRPDPRPVRGLLHGLYVFVAVWRFWDQVRRDPALDPLLRALAVDRVLWIGLNLVIGRGQLAAARDRLSAAGRAVLALLSDDVEQVTAEIERAGLPLTSPALCCDEDGQIRRRTTPGGRPVTVADTLGHQLRRFAATSPAAIVG